MIIDDFLEARNFEQKSGKETKKAGYGKKENSSRTREDANYIAISKKRKRQR